MIPPLLSLPPQVVNNPPAVKSRIASKGISMRAGRLRRNAALSPRKEIPRNNNVPAMNGKASIEVPFSNNVEKGIPMNPALLDALFRINSAVRGMELPQYSTLKVKVVPAEPDSGDTPLFVSEGNASIPVAGLQADDEATVRKNSVPDPGSYSWR